jgi:hypothetical protein
MQTLQLLRERESMASFVAAIVSAASPLIVPDKTVVPGAFRSR